MVERRWVWRREPGPIPPALLDVVREFGPDTGPLVARLLWNRGIETADAAAAFLRPTLAQGLRSPALLPDMDIATRRLADAIESGERIAVYGDYDVDGVTGAAILTLFLRQLGADPLVHVSHRAREGYGLHAGALHALHGQGARVVVTADLGTANVAELALAQGLGMDVIVCDHHHAPQSRPPALAVLNPLRSDAAFPFKGLSGAGVAFYLLMGLRMELRRRGHTGLPDLRRYLDLVALGAVADVVPLREENRVLVSNGLRELERTVRPGLIALKEAALVERPTVRSIAFRLAPRLNAGGRLADARIAVDALTTDDPERARTLVAELEVHNAERRSVEERMTREAIALVEAGQNEAAGLVVAAEGWHHGVVGIVAARLAERWHRAALVIALDGGEGRGSGRSTAGVHLLDAVGACHDLLETFGGHRQAVGFRVRGDRIDGLRERFSAAVAAQTATRDMRPCLEIDAELSLAQVTTEMARALALCEPHGEGNPEPRFVTRGVRIDGSRMVGDPSRPHLKLRLRQDGRTLPAIAFGQGHLPLVTGDRVDLVFIPRLGTWRGVERLEIEVVAINGPLAEDGCQPTDSAVESAIP